MFLFFSAGGGPVIERTGTFRYVRHERVDDFHRRGWMVVGELGPVHGMWSALMWRCDCPELGSAPLAGLHREWAERPADLVLARARSG